MSQLPPAALIRLREADIVRLCGLEAAAAGLELASHRAVTFGRRRETRLEAQVEDGERLAVWAEVQAGNGVPALRWHCPCRLPPEASAEGAPAGTLGCAHVAALLTAWIRHPADFRAPASSALDSAPIATGAEPASPRPHLAQPALLPAPKRPRLSRRATLEDELAHLSAADVVALARRVLGVEASEHEARMLLAGTLREPGRLEALLARLEAGPRLLLADLQLLGGALTAADLEGLALRSGRLPSAMRADLAVLERHGLVFPTPGTPGATSAGRDRSWRQFAGWRIPADLRAVFPTMLSVAPLPAPDPRRPPLPAHAPAAEPAPPPGARITRTSPRPLALALALLARAPAPYGPFASPRQPAIDRGRGAAVPVAAPLPLLSGELAPGAVAECARAAGVSPGVVRLARRLLLWGRESGTGHALSDLATMPASERPLALRAGFRLWRDMESPAELADLNLPGSTVRVELDAAHPAFRPAALAAEVAAARAFVLAVVERLRPGEWYALDDLMRLIWRVNPGFLRGRQATYASPAWWLARADDRRPLRTTEWEEWQAGEGRYIRLLLVEYLHAWGAVELAADLRQGPYALRLTPFGTYLLGLVPDVPAEIVADASGDGGGAVLPTRGGGLAVQPLIAPLGLLDALAGWARVTELASGRLVYTLAPDLACEAFDRGATPEALLAHLRTGEPGGAARAATSVAARLEGWRHAYGASRIESGWVLVEAPDEATLAEALAHVPELAAHGRRIAPDQALLRPEDVADLKRALARRGYSL